MSKKTKPEAEEQEQVKTEAPAEETAKADAKPATDWEMCIRDRLQIAKCNLPLQHLLRDQPQIGIIQLTLRLHAAQQHLIHRQHGVERLLRE